MATGLTKSGTSNLASGQAIWIASAIMAFEPSAPNPDLISSKTIPAGHKQWDVNVMARLANATDLTEGVDLSSVEQLVASNVSITPSEHGVLAAVTKRQVRRQGDMDVYPAVGKMLANSLRRRMDVTVMALYDGFSKSGPGASQPLDTTDLRGSYAYLRTDNSSSYGPAQLPLRASLHVEQISDIVADLGPRGTHPFPEGLSADLIKNWWRANHRVYAMEIFESGNMARDSSGDSKGAIFNEAAMCIVVANETDFTQEDDNSLRARELGVFQEWGEKEIADPWGVEIYSDTVATI